MTQGTVNEPNITSCSIYQNAASRVLISGSDEVCSGLFARIGTVQLLQTRPSVDLRRAQVPSGVNLRQE
jgi:hypothetical protein